MKDYQSFWCGEQKDAKEARKMFCWCWAYVNMESCALKYHKYFTKSSCFTIPREEKTLRMNFFLHSITAALGGMRSELRMGLNRSFSHPFHIVSHAININKNPSRGNNKIYICTGCVHSVEGETRKMWSKDTEKKCNCISVQRSFLFFHSFAICKFKFSNCLISRVSHTHCLKRHCAVDYFIRHMKNQQNLQSEKLKSRRAFMLWIKSNLNFYDVAFVAHSILHRMIRFVSEINLVAFKLTSSGWVGMSG